MRLQQCACAVCSLNAKCRFVCNSKAKRDCGVNPCLWSSNWSRPHLSTYIVINEGQEGAVLLCESKGWRIRFMPSSSTPGWSPIPFRLLQFCLLSFGLLNVSTSICSSKSYSRNVFISICSSKSHLLNVFNLQ